MLFSRQCYSMLKAGVPIMDTLNSIQDYSRNPSLKATLAEVRTDLDSGRQLSQAMSEHPRIFSEFYISMIRAGEQSGALEDSFLTLSAHIRFDKQTKDRNLIEAFSDDDPNSFSRAAERQMRGQTLVDDAIDHLKRGDTSLSEVIRIVYQVND